MRLSKRSVQLVGIVVMVGLAGGFALASINSPGTNQQTVTSNGTTSTTFQATGWSVAVNPTAVTLAGAQATCVSGIAPAAAHPCTAGEQTEAYVYSFSGTCAASPDDAFLVTTTGVTVTAGPDAGATGTSNTYTDTTAGCPGFTLYVDFGVAATDVVTVTGISISVSGNS